MKCGKHVREIRYVFIWERTPPNFHGKQFGFHAATVLASVPLCPVFVFTLAAFQHRPRNWSHRIPAKLYNNSGQVSKQKTVFFFFKKVNTSRAKCWPNQYSSRKIKENQTKNNQMMENIVKPSKEQPRWSSCFGMCWPQLRNVLAPWSVLLKLTQHFGCEWG